MEDKSKTNNVFLVFFFAMVIVITISILLLSSWISNSDYESPYVNVGEEGVLYSDELEYIGLAVTKADFDELIDSSVANDKIGYAEVYERGDAYFVDVGTRVLVIDSSIGAKEVRILEGDLYGETGWVVQEYVIKPENYGLTEE